MAKGGTRVELNFRVPTALVPAVLAFARENGYVPREALLVLVEGGLNAYPRWGVKRAIVDHIRSEMRVWYLTQVLGKLKEVDESVKEMLHAALFTEEDKRPVEPVDPLALAQLPDEGPLP